jgi:hypothetical protein
MPLTFSSNSHGTIAFGFFNIESDMLLLQELFFFADRFCEAVLQLARERGETRLEGWRLDDPSQVGDLHGAIAGQNLSGFIGATYRCWPFPQHPEGFKQNPDGHKTQQEVQEMIATFGQPAQIPLAWEGQTISVDAYRFDQQAFCLLVGYVDRGGYPRWRDEVRPSYVRRMMEQLADLGSPLLPR